MVADILRIRHVHLLAIEEGRYNDLPGATYAAGFVRAYAEHLGLDGTEIVRRFKDEGLANASKSELSFPVPAAEGGIPSGALLAIAVLLAGLVYGAWYWNSTADRPLVDLIQDVPERLGALVKGSSDDSTAEREPLNPPADVPAQAPAVAPITTTQPTKTAETLGSLPNAPEPKTAEAPAGALAPVTPPTAAPAPETTSGTTSETTPEAAPAEPAKADTAKVEPAKTEPAKAPVTTAAPPAATPAPAAAAAPAPTADATPAPAVAAAEPAPHVSATRIEIYAQADAWVQIRNGKDLVVSRLFKRGEVYAVPDNASMVLRTGNAGGTQIRLDGKTLPPLGKDGEVLSGISLTPDALKARAEN